MLAAFLFFRFTLIGGAAVPEQASRAVELGVEVRAALRFYSASLRRTKEQNQQRKSEISSANTHACSATESVCAFVSPPDLSSAACREGHKTTHNKADGAQTLIITIKAKINGRTVSNSGVSRSRQTPSLSANSSGLREFCRRVLKIAGAD